MAGLSSAAFLTLAGRSVALLEKHDKLGGFASSFKHLGVSFDIGIEGVRELASDSFLIRGDAARDDLIAAFPASVGRIDRFFDLNARIVAEMTGGPAPKPPRDLGLIEKFVFGMSSLTKRPNLLHRGLWNCSKVIPDCSMTETFPG